MKNKKMGNQIKLLMVTWNYPPKVGGMEQLMYQLVQHSYPEIVTTVLAPYTSNQGPVDKSEVIRSPNNSLIGFFISSLIQGSKRLHCQKYDLIMGGSALVLPLVILLSKIYQIPSVVYAHGLDLIYRNPIYQLMIRLLLSRTDHIITNSLRTKEIVEEKGVFPEKISVLNPGVDAQKFILNSSQEEIRKRYDLVGKKVLLSAGRLVKRKGVYDFIKYSLKTIVQKHPEVLYVVIGENPQSSLSHKEDILQLSREETKKQGLADHVRFMGLVDHSVLLDLYKASDVFVLPAVPVNGDMEGFGIVLIEANAAGCPVVTTMVGGIPDAVDRGKSGIIVQPGDWEIFSESVIGLLEDPSLRQEMGNYGQERVNDLFDWSRKAIQFVTLLESVLNWS